MKKIIIAVLIVASTILSSCKEISSLTSSIASNTTSFSSDKSSSSSSKEIDPNDEYYKKTVEDFPYYFNYINYTSQVWCWKKDDGRWYSGFRMGNTPPISTVENMLENIACPIPVMKEMISYRNSTDPIALFEMEYPFTLQAYWQVSFVYFEYASRNRNLYEMLDLESSYENFYGNEEYHEISGDFNAPNLKMQSKYFTSESHIYCWQDNNGEWKCGVGPERHEQYGLDYGAYFWIRDEVPCTLVEMKSLIDSYYNHYAKIKANKIIEVPFTINNYGEYKGAMEGYPNILSTNAYLYNELGLQNNG